MLVDLTVGISCVDILMWCQDNGVCYTNTASTSFIHNINTRTIFIVNDYRRVFSELH
jgi:homospermidine synthase